MKEDAIAGEKLGAIAARQGRHLCLGRGGLVLDVVKNLFYGKATASPARNWKSMDVEKTIAEIEWLEHIFALPDTRCLRLADREAANRKHDDMYAANQ